jgi:dTDP-glucose 4,6-dehydratase
MAYLRQRSVDSGIARIFNNLRAVHARNNGCAIPTLLRQALIDDLSRGLMALAKSGAHEPVDIKNPAELSLLEMAELVIELAESRSENLFEARPLDDLRIRQPDITGERDLLGWEPEVDVREDLAWTIERYESLLREAVAR